MTTQTPVFTINLECPPLSEFQRQLEAELAAINAKWAESDAQFSRAMRIRRYLAERAGRLSALRRRALKLQLTAAQQRLADLA